MKKPDYKFIFQVLEFLFNNRKAIVELLAKAGKGLKEICILDVTRKIMTCVAAFQRYALVPVLCVSFVVLGTLVVLQSFFKTQSIYISICWALFVFVWAVIEVKIVLRYTPKVKIILLVLEE